MKEKLLRNLYWDKELSLREIGFLLGVSDDKIRYWMIKFKIPRRLNYELKRTSDHEQLLRELYWDKELSLSCTAHELGVGVTTVRSWMSKFGIPHRSISDAKKGHTVSKEARIKLSRANKGRNHPGYGKPRSEETRRKIGEPQKGKKNHMYGKHHTDETKRKLSKVLKGKTRSLKTRRKISEANTGSRHPNWQGGKSFEPYPVEFNEKLKRSIKKRDNNICQICRKAGKGVHHIDYNKENCDSSNLVTLCTSCHQKTNYNHEKWMRYFRTVLLQPPPMELII